MMNISQSVLRIPKNCHRLPGEYGIIAGRKRNISEFIFNLVKEGKINVLFPGDLEPRFRKEEFKHVIHWRASYQDEARV